MRNLFYIMGSLTVLSFLFVQGCRGLKRTIYSSMDCDQFNIDHIELRTGINIPKIKRLHCEIQNNTRKVGFLLRKTGSDEIEYAKKYFTWNGTLYTAAGKNPETEWIATYDSTTNIFELQLEYLNHE